jgi:hypothetical protein
VSEVGVERARVYEWLKQRQVFAARYMPAWSHRAWYGQQTSPLLLGALTVSEIVVISDFHSLLDRLTRTSEFLSGRLGQLEKLREKITDRMTQWSWERANAENDGRLWNSLLGDLQKAADMENPLRAAIDRHALGYEVGQAAAQH